MSKVKKTGKAQVRNSNVSVCPQPVIQNSHKLKKVHFVEEKTESVQSNDLISPEFCTLLQLANEIKKVKNLEESSHSLSDEPRYRNLNFLPQEKVFQDLVELELPNKELLGKSKSQPSLRVTLKKDPEPDFNKFLDYALQPKYLFPSYATPSIKKEKSVFDGRSIYNKIKYWKSEVENF